MILGVPHPDLEVGSSWILRFQNPELRGSGILAPGSQVSSLWEIGNLDLAIPKPQHSYSTVLIRHAGLAQPKCDKFPPDSKFSDGCVHTSLLSFYCFSSLTTYSNLTMASTIITKNIGNCSMPPTTTMPMQVHQQEQSCWQPYGPPTSFTSQVPNGINNSPYSEKPFIRHSHKSHAFQPLQYKNNTQCSNTQSSLTPP